jgi:hypothetical protein
LNTKTIIPIFAVHLRFKSRQMRNVGHESCMEKIKTTYGSLSQKPDGRRPLGGLRF